MFAIIGIVVVFGCIVAGYLMEHGNLRVLLQPAELVIIGGAALGTVMIANPLHIIKKIVGGIGGVFGASKFGKQVYLDALKMMYDLLNKARKDGLMALEADVEEPEKSPIFSKNPASCTTTTFAPSSATRCAWPSPVSMLLISTRCSISTLRFTITNLPSPRLRSVRWPIRCLAWESWLPS